MFATLRLIGLRPASALPSLAGVIIVTFVLTRALPGDPAAFFAGPAASPQAIEEIRAKLGLDRNVMHQFGVYIRTLLHGDLGTSLTTGQNVIQDLLTRLPASLELTFCAIAFAVGVALPLGIWAATHPDAWIDHAVRVLTTAGVSLPTFFTGLTLIYVFYFLLGWMPAPLGRLDVFLSPPASITSFYLLDSVLARDLHLFWACLLQLVLPATTLGVFAMAPIARMTRAAMLGVLSSEFIRTARASGLAPGVILYTYALRNALLPVVTTLGMVFSFLLGANVLVEKVFAWPGIGSYALEALLASDYAPVQGFVLTMAILYVGLNLVIDIVYGLIDPRIRMTS